MRTIDKALRLQHHSHTGRRLQHKHTSYRGLAVVLVLAGIFIAGLSMMARVTADGLVQVTARIPAPIPADPPVITSPVDGYATRDADITVSGNCPVITPRVIIAIFDNDNLMGSAPCDSDQTFSVNVTLSPGQNELLARVFTITNDTGRDSVPVHVTFTPPEPPNPGSNDDGGGGSVQNSDSGDTNPPFDITIDAPFVVYGPDLPADWEGTITGGTLPYQLHIDWGDGSSSDFTITQSGQQEFKHQYSDIHAYVMTFTVTDSAGDTVSHQYAAVTPYVAPFTGSAIPSKPGPFIGSPVIGLYGAYLFSLGAVGTLWVLAPHQFAYAKILAHHNIGHYKTTARKPR